MKFAVHKTYAKSLFILLRKIQRASLCPINRRHACFIINKMGIILGIGVNKPPIMPANCTFFCRGMKKEDMLKICRSTHAEIMALNTTYPHYFEQFFCIALVTKKPCASCEKALFTKGVKQIIWEEIDELNNKIIDKGVLDAPEISNS